MASAPAVKVRPRLMAMAANQIVMMLNRNHVGASNSLQTESFVGHYIGNCESLQTSLCHWVLNCKLRACIQIMIDWKVAFVCYTLNIINPSIVGLISEFISDFFSSRRLLVQLDSQKRLNDQSDEIQIYAHHLTAIQILRQQQHRLLCVDCKSRLWMEEP